MNRNDISKLCHECMSEHVDEGICRDCGFNNGNEPEHSNEKTLAPCTVIAERYCLGKVISYSEFSEVYYAYDLVDEKRVIVECVINKYNRVPYYTNALKDTETMIKDVSARIAKGAELERDDIIPYIDCFEDDDSFFYVSDFYEGITLGEYLEQRNGLFKMGETVDMLSKIAAPLSAMHEAGLVNGCISEDRVIIDKNGNVRVKDTDAFAVLFADKSEREDMVKSSWIPCEFYTPGTELLPKSDIYSVAAICYRMLSGKNLPLACEREYDEEIQHPNSLGANLTDEGFEILAEALRVYSEDRPDILSAFAVDFSEANAPVIEIENDLSSEFSDVFEKAYEPVSIEPEEPSKEEKLPEETVVEEPEEPEEPEEAEEAENIPNAQADQDDEDVKDDIGAAFEDHDSYVDEDGYDDYFETESSRRKSSGKKGYRGINLRVKTAVITVFSVFLLCMILVFAGIVDPVALFVSADADVPNVVGMELEKAKAELEKSGLHILVAGARIYPSVQSNCVYAQTPRGNITSKRGNLVSVSVSLGDYTPVEGEVPNVRYMMIDDAFKVLRDCGYNVTVSLASSDDVMPGCVLNQSELSGVQLPKGETVSLLISSGSLLQEERAEISNMAMKSAVMFIDNGMLYDVRVADMGDTLGNDMPQHPSESEHNNLSFIGWSRAENGTGGEFASDSKMAGAMLVYAFFADENAVIATPTPAPQVSIEPIEPTPFNISTPLPSLDMTFVPDVTPTEPSIILTESPTIVPTKTPEPTRTPEPTKSPEPTKTPEPTDTPEPTKTPEPTPSYYLDGIEFSATEITIRVGETRRLNVVFDGNPESKELKYRSSNGSIATISSSGDVKGVAVGETYVYAISQEDGIHEAKCKVIVIEADENSAVDPIEEYVGKYMMKELTV